MTTREQMIAEFNAKADRAVYEKGSERFEARLPKDIGLDEAYELTQRCAKSALEDDGYTSEFGQLTVEEMYFLLIEGYDYEVANDYLREIEYYETEAVA